MIEIKKVVSITHTNRNIKRYAEIIRVIFKYGFGGIFGLIRLDGILQRVCKAIRRECNYEISNIRGLPIEVRCRMVLEELGPTFIKLGQLLSTRPDLMPARFTIEFSKLQDNAPRFSTEDAFKIIEEELGEDIYNIFDDFNEEPIAAASIGQVYKAIYRGEEVIVKVLRPNIKRIITTDIEIMLHLARMLERYITEIAQFKPSTIIEEFARSLYKEINLKNEARSTKRFRQNIKNNPYIYAPKVYDELTTEKVLVAEFINGIKPENIEDLKKENYDLILLAEHAVDSVLKQIFEYGFFHADPHPGNIFIMPDNIVCFIDFGMVNRVSLRQKDYFASLIFNIINRRSQKIADILLKLTHWDVEPDTDALERDLFGIIDEYLLYSLKDINFGKFLSELMEIFARYNLRLKSEIYMLLKALVSLEKTGKLLAPEVNIIERAAPYVKRIYRQRFNIRRIFKNLLDPVSDMLEFGAEFPDNMRIIIKNLKSGRLRINIEHKGIENLIKSINIAGSKISIAMVLSSLIIGVSMIISAYNKAPYYLYKIETFGFAIIFILGVIFLLYFFRK